MAAFVTKRGLDKLVVMPFGLANAPATFQRMMDSMISDVKGKWAWVHIDDLLIYSPTWEEYLKHMEETFKRLRKEGITLKIKCELAKAQLKYLGHIVSNDSVAPIPSRVEQVANCAAARNRKELRQFLGLANYYCFVKDYSPVAKPLTMLTSPKVECVEISVQTFLY